MLSKPRTCPLPLSTLALLLEGYNKAISLGKYSDMRIRHPQKLPGSFVPCLLRVLHVLGET